MSSIKLILSIALFLTVLEPITAVRYRVIDGTDRNPEKSKFRRQIGYSGSVHSFTYANELVRGMLDLKLGDPRYDDVILTIQSFHQGGSVASTVGNHIRINTDYLENFRGDMYAEFMGILLHESTHVWQWDGKGTAPRGLINGIADFVRLSTGWPSAGWTEQRGSGSRWDQGYAVTAYFLEYCDGLKSGFVSELNALMVHHYSDDFFRQLLGKGVHQLWEDYKRAYQNNYRILDRSTDQSNYPPTKETAIGEKSGASEDYWQVAAEKDFTEKQISAPNEDAYGMKQALDNCESTAESKTFTGSKEQSLVIVSSRHDTPIQFSGTCSGFKDCLAYELKLLRHMVKILSSMPTFCNGPRKIGMGCQIKKRQ